MILECFRRTISIQIFKDTFSKNLCLTTILCVETKSRLLETNGYYIDQIGTNADHSLHTDLLVTVFLFPVPYMLNRMKENNVKYSDDFTLIQLFPNFNRLTWLTDFISPVKGQFLPRSSYHFLIILHVAENCCYCWVKHHVNKASNW